MILRSAGTHEEGDYSNNQAAATGTNNILASKVLQGGINVNKQQSNSMTQNITPFQNQVQGSSSATQNKGQSIFNKQTPGRMHPNASSSSGTNEITRVGESAPDYNQGTRQKMPNFISSTLNGTQNGSTTFGSTNNVFVSRQANQKSMSEAKAAKTN